MKLISVSLSFSFSLLAIAASSPFPRSKRLVTSSSSTINPVEAIDIAILKRVNLDIITPDQRLNSLQAGLSRTISKYNITESIATLEKRAEPIGFVQLGDAPDDNEYYATILLGTPPVAYEVALDTGSADLVIISAPCTVGCDTTTVVYRPSDSTTSVVTSVLYQINYQVGGGTGLVVTDTLTFGGYTLPHQAFGALTASTTVAGAGGINAVFGLARQTLSLLGQVPFVQALYLDGLLPAPLFGFAPARWGLTASTVEPGGVLTLGGVNSTLFSGAITYMPVTSQFYWEIAVNDLTVGGVSLGISSRQVSIDTGTTNIYVPLATATAIYAKIAGSRAVGGGLYIFSCSATINFAMNFGGVSFPMLDADFNIGAATSDGQLCFGAISALTTSQYIIGDAFLKNVYSAFRFSPASVGFATLSNPNQLKTGYIPVGDGVTVGAGGNIVVGVQSTPIVIPAAAAAVVVTAPVLLAPGSVVGTAAVVSPAVVAVPVVASSSSGTAASAAIAAAAAAVLNVPIVVSAPVVTPTANVEAVLGFASLIQAAVVNDIASATRNAVTVILCPNSIDKSADIWVCTAQSSK